MDWRQWRRLNPSRRLLAESPFRDIILKDFPASAPRGVLVEARDKPASRAEVSEGAARLLATSSVSGVSRFTLNVFTQEVYVLRAYGIMLEWYLRFLGPGDESTAGRMQGLLLGF